jgi:hypothetical protein
MAGTLKKGGPRALGAGSGVYTTDLLNGGAGGAASGGSNLIFDILRHVHIANKLAADSFRMYLGATGGTAAGTELFFDYPTTAKGVYDFYWATRLVSTDFISGGSATTLTHVIEFDLEEYVI